MGVQPMPDNAPEVGGEIETAVVLLTPPDLAVTFTDVKAETVPAVELKLADAKPAGTVTLAGTGSDGDDVARFTVAFDCVTDVRATAQLMLPPELTDVGLHEILEREGVLPEPTFTPPAELDSGTLSPRDDTPRPPFTPTPTVVPLARLDASVTVTTATTPDGMAFALDPTARHEYVPVPAVQFSDLPALASAGPPATCSEAICEGEYDKSHSMPAAEGWLEVSDKLRLADAPGAAVEDESDRPDWACSAATEASRRIGDEYMQRIVVSELCAESVIDQ